MPLHPRSFPVFLLLAVAAVVPAGAQDDVVLYRCTDATGALTISDAPCPAGQRQQVMSMLRPTDAPAPPATPPAMPAAATAPAPATPTVVLRTAPRPLYECVRPDGSVYESETGDGEPRWVPLWTLGYPGVYGGTGVHGGRPLRAGPGPHAATASGLSAPARSGISLPPPRDRPVQRTPRRQPSHPGHAHGFAGVDPGTWVRDECHPLPQGEVCARLVDRRDAVRTRFFNAQQRERDTLRVEERGLDARLAQDCGVR